MITGIFIGISISSVFWGIKFIQINKKAEDIYIECAERYMKWKKLDEEINKLKGDKR